MYKTILNFDDLAVTCDTNILEAPENGMLFSDKGLTVMSLASYSCQSGFELEGSSITVCQDSSYWSILGNEPTCSSENYLICYVYLLFRHVHCFRYTVMYVHT